MPRAVNGVVGLSGDSSCIMKLSAKILLRPRVGWNCRTRHSSLRRSDRRTGNIDHFRQIGIFGKREKFASDVRCAQSRFFIETQKRKMIFVSPVVVARNHILCFILSERMRRCNSSQCHFVTVKLNDRFRGIVNLIP